MDGLKRRAVSVIAILFFLTALPHVASSQLQQMTPATDLDSAAVVFAFQWPDSRSALPVAAFQSDVLVSAPMDMADFLPAGIVFPGGAIRGELTIHATPLTVDAIGPDAPSEVMLPELTVGIVGHGDRIVPVPFGDGIVVDQRQPVHLIPGVGRIWSEPADEGPSRALIPVSLVDADTGDVRNGVLAFLYADGRPVSDGLIQFSQETAPRREANLWGRVSFSFAASDLPEGNARIESYGERQASSPEYRNWEELEAVGSETPNEFGPALSGAEALSTSGLIVDDIVYLRECRTRHGSYPFCRQMRHAVRGISYPLLASVALANFANRFGNGLYEVPMGEVVPDLAEHPRWRDMRTIDIIDMASGLGETGPIQVPGFVDADDDETAVAIRQAPTLEEKLEQALRFPHYPWNAGEVFRYRSSDSFGLALVLHKLAVERYTGSPSLRQALQNFVYDEIGIPRMHMRMTNGDAPADRVPDIADGLLPTTGELIRLTLLLRRTANERFRTPLEDERIRDVLSDDDTIGHPTGRYWVDGEARYHFGFWRIPFRASEECLVPVAAGLGAGGSVVGLLPNGLTVFRLSDADPEPDDAATLDLFRAAHMVRPVCG